MQNPSLLKHLRDILLLPFTMSVVVPYLIYNSHRQLVREHDLLLKISGFMVGLVGVALLLYTIFLFRRFGMGTLAPWRPTQKLVVAGPYRYCRKRPFLIQWTSCVGRVSFLLSTLYTL